MCVVMKYIIYLLKYCNSDAMRPMDEKKLMRERHRLDVVSFHLQYQMHMEHQDGKPPWDSIMQKCISVIEKGRWTDQPVYITLENLSSYAREMSDEEKKKGGHEVVGYVYMKILNSASYNFDDEVSFPRMAHDESGFPRLRSINPYIICVDKQ